jgi:predicted nucleotidyltransferase
MIEHQHIGAEQESRPLPLLAPRVQSYLDELIAAGTRIGRRPVSIILFGSAAKGAFSEGVSDVDVIAVAPDGLPQAERQVLRDEFRRLENLHGLRAQTKRARNWLQAYADRVSGIDFSFFICTRGELVSADVARVLGLTAVEMLFVDRTVFASIIASSVTVWGEDLLPHISLKPIRRFDVLKAYFSFMCQLLLWMCAFPLLPNATQCGLATLKHALHNCYFCYKMTTAPLAEEIAFFTLILGQSGTLTELLSLRQRYRKSFRFVVRCLGTVTLLHFRTARDNAFPQEISRPS